MTPRSKEPPVKKYLRFSSRGANNTGQPIAPPELRPRLVADVVDQESNLKDVIIGILAEYFSVPFERGNRQTEPNDHSDVCLLIPAPLYRKLAAAANSATPPISVQRQILTVLCRHYGLRMIPPQKQTRRRGRRRRPTVTASD